MARGLSLLGSPTLGVASSEGNKKALKEHLEGKKKQRKGV